MTDNYTRNGYKGVVNIKTSLVANPQTAELVKPTEGAFDYPAKDAQTTAVIGIATRDAGCYADRFQGLAMRIRIIGTVGKQFVETIAWTAHFAFDGRYVVDQFEQFGDIMLIGCRGVCDDGNAVAIRQQMVFGAQFSPIYRAGAGFFAPPTARIVALSTAHRAKSISSAVRRRSKSVWWMAAQTPASCQSRRRRQQVIPQPQSISWGSISQGMPEVRTKRIPVRHLRSSIGFRPGFFFRRGLSGICGSMQFHSSSLSSALAMTMSPKREVSSQATAKTIPLC